MQKPEATLVAGYKALQKNFERHVNKGEKAVRILAPAPYKIKEERDKLDPVTGEMMFDENGMPQKEEVEVTIPAFRAVSVFDVSQTDGKPIQELEAQELLSAVEGYEDFVQALINVAPVPIGFEDISGDSKGYFHTEENRIAVQENMSESQTLKTMVHEVVHFMLHNKEINREDLMEEPVKDRNTKEVEAESVAYTVCQHFGIDTSDYSFGYIAGWSSGKDMKELKSSLDTIRKTASELITGIEGALQELQINRAIEQEQSKESKYDFMNNKVVDVTRYDARVFLERLAKEFSGNTVKQLHTFLKCVFAECMGNGCIGINPFSVSINPDCTVKEALSKTQQEGFLNYVYKSKKYCKYYDYIVILMETGLRLGEFLGLTVDCIDFAKRRILVSKQVESNGNITKELKTRTSKRYVEISDKTEISLQNIIANLPKRRYACNGFDDFLIVTRNGKPKAHTEVDRLVREIRREYQKNVDKDFPDVTPHTFRHTFATNKALEGMSVLKLYKQM